MAWFKSSPNCLAGVDVSTSAVKVIELAKRGQQYCVEAYGVAPLPAGAIINREIKDVAAVSDAVSKAVVRSGTRAKHASVAMRSSSVITKVIQLDAHLSENEMSEQVAHEASRYIPFSMDEVSLDFEVLGPAMGAGDNQGNRVDVLVAACRRNDMELLVDIVNDTGLAVDYVDVEPYAMERACRLLSPDLPEQGKDKTILMIDLGATVTTLTVLHNLKTVYMREEDFGGFQLTKAIQDHYDLSYEEAGKAKKMGKFKETYEQDVLAPFRDALVPLIRRSLQYFYSAAPYEKIDHILLAGGSANIQGLTETLESQFNTTVSLANPFAKMRIASAVNEKSLIADASALMVPCGLAMRGLVE